MKELNLIGGPFQHAHSSTWWKHAKEITWLKNVYKSDISVYVDNSIMRGLADHFKGEKYATGNSVQMRIQVRSLPGS